MTELIAQLSLVLIVIALLAVILRFIKQPPLVAYLLTGLGLSWIGFHPDVHALEIVAEIGIILLLFLAGLEVKLKEFLKLGPKTLIIGEGHDMIMGVIGFVLSFFLLKVGVLPAFYLAICLTLSSTIVVVKALDARKELSAPHGKILLGTMILQDIVAMIALAIFTSLDSGGSLPIIIGKTLLKGVAVFAILYALGKFGLPKIFNYAAQNVELIFLLGLGWCFAGVGIAHSLAFSKEIGAFLAGMAIADLPFSFEITDKARSLQDFGLLLFFVTVGLQVTITPQTFMNPTLWILLAFVLVTTPLITGILTSFVGFPKKEAFLMSTMPVQVSEFSLVLIAIGKKLGHVSDELFTLVTLVTIITIVISSGIVANIGGIFKKLEGWLDFLEWKLIDKPRQFQESLDDHIVILGFGQLGQFIAEYYKKQRKQVVVVDWRPEVMDAAEKIGCKLLYGDAGDSDVWEQLGLSKSHMIISTIGNNQDDDLHLMRWAKKQRSRAIMISESNDLAEVKQLYKVGYDLVLVQDEAEWLVLREFLGKTPGQQRRTTEQLLRKATKMHVKKSRGYAARAGL